MDHVLEEARQRLELGSNSFAAAARLLPSSQRASITLLYSWCRHCDDEVDNEVLGIGEADFGGARAAERLEELKRETRRALEGHATSPPFLALQRVVATHAIPHRYPLELLEGMAMDASGHTFERIEETLRYAYHVAGVVGVMSAIVLGVSDRPTLVRASDLGIAFQLTNIARDVVSDARRGRVYLPEDWLREFGIERARVSHPEERQRLARAVGRLIALSEGYYRSASAGVVRLPFRAALTVAAARRIYHGIGDRLTLAGPGAWDTRVKTSKLDKVVAIAAAGFEVVTSGRLMAFGDRSSREGLWTPAALSAGSAVSRD